MKVAVLGAGAIGAYVGAALHRAGADVHLIARGPHLAAMRQDGVRVLSPRGDFTARPRATDDPAEVGPVDFVFLGLKANSYAACGPLIEPLLHGTTAVVAAQNGIPWWYFHRHGGPYEGRRLESVRCSRPNAPSVAWCTRPPNSNGPVSSAMWKAPASRSASPTAASRRAVSP
jgi:2-dehydropantoate 2-reductase